MIERNAAQRGVQGPSLREIVAGLVVLSVLAGVVLVRGGTPRASDAFPLSPEPRAAGGLAQSESGPERMDTEQEAEAERRPAEVEP